MELDKNSSGHHTIWPDIPCEIWVKIFLYLSSGFRKYIIRYVCSYFNSVVLYTPILGFKRKIPHTYDEFTTHDKPEMLSFLLKSIQLELQDTLKDLNLIP